MNYIYIATVLVMLILILLTGMSIMILVNNTSKNIRDKTMELISIYDGILEGKSQELHLTKVQIESAAQKHAQPNEGAKETISTTIHQPQGLSMNSVGTVENIEKANYVNTEVASLYQLIRQHFSHDAKKLLKDFPEDIKNPKKGIYSNLLEELSYENMYDLSFLSCKEQVDCLLETLDSCYHELIHQYEENNNFSSIEFYAYLQEQSAMEGKQAIVYVSPAAKIKEIEGVQVKINEAICEGIQIEINHVLYDYAIQKKEIGGHVNS